jgi:hypothetical protein
MYQVIRNIRLVAESAKKGLKLTEYHNKMIEKISKNIGNSTFGIAQQFLAVSEFSKSEARDELLSSL